jgi:hypothetical protein
MIFTVILEVQFIKKNKRIFFVVADITVTSKEQMENQMS